MCKLVWFGILLLVASRDIDAAANAGETGIRREWKVGGVTREAMVYAPGSASASAKTSEAPLLFVFHGHGGTMRNAALGLVTNRFGRKRSSFTRKGRRLPGD